MTVDVNHYPTKNLSVKYLNILKPWCIWAKKKKSIKIRHARNIDFAVSLFTFSMNIIKQAYDMSLLNIMWTWTGKQTWWWDDVTAFNIHESRINLQSFHFATCISILSYTFICNRRIGWMNISEIWQLEVHS